MEARGGRRPDAAELFEAVLAGAPAAMAFFDADLRIVRANAALAALDGLDPEAHAGKRVADIAPELAETIDALLRRALAGEQVRDAALRAGDRDWVLGCFPVRDAVGRVIGAGATVDDVTERLAAEGAVRRSEERLRQMAEHLPLVFWLTNADATEIWYISPGYERVWGRSVESLETDPGSFLAAVHPDDRTRAQATQALVGYDEEYRVIRPDGSVAWVRDRAFEICDDGGRRVARTGFVMDVTESKVLEAQLRQAQKMEGLGRLAGGIAHDFNNMLTLIEGYGELALAKLASGADAAGEVREMLAAGERATELTRRLLTFSRHRPPRAGYARVNDVVADMEELLRRLIGEDVRITTRLDPDAGAVAVDPVELGQVVMNLAVNARDAMRGGGELAIETSVASVDPGSVLARSGARAGAHVVLAVRDTGAGMTAETVEHAFDPFFTTKPPGEGTGLGLATVYGIVEQAGGHVGLRSAPGEGTEVTLHLPVTAARPAAEVPDPPAAGSPGAGGTVLVAEDEPALRALVALVLRDAGYTVLEAGSGDEALRVAGAHARPFDLLVTDVVMPGLGGPELAAALRSAQPGLRTIFVSGYPERGEGSAPVPEGEEFLPKPFSPEALVRKVRGVLDEPQRPAPNDC
jgi:two-component system cell cycle sensor histidine kinase/response regulator CckA